MPVLDPTERASLDELGDRPHAVAFDDGPRTVRLSLDAGDSVPEHAHPDRNVVVAVLNGELTLRLDGEDHRLSTGDLLRFDGRRRVVPEARTDTTALVVLSHACRRA
jgi:redox-sensitive bicupin YhaK (pirin superfamily)